MASQAQEMKPNATVSLETLPPEIWHQITAAIDWKGCECDLNSLIRTNKLLYARCIHRLYDISNDSMQERLAHWAIEHSRREPIQRAGSFGVDPIWETGRLLLMAVRKSSTAFVIFLLEQPWFVLSGESKSVDLALQYAVNSYYCAVGNHDVALPRKLIDNYGATVTRDGYPAPRWSILNDVAARGRADVLELLIERGASVETASEWPRCLLSTAAHRGDVAMARILLDHGMLPNRWRGRSSPMHSAAHSGEIELLDLLIERGGNVKLKDNNGRTPLHVAAYAGNLEMTVALLERGAGMDVKDRKGISSLARACWVGSLEVVEALLARGAKKDNPVPLIILAVSGPEDWCESLRLSLVHVLLKYGANPNEQRPKGGASVLSEALNHNRYDVARLLVRSGANLEEVDSNGKTLLLRLVQSKRPKLRSIAILVEMGASLSTSTGAGLNVVHCAAKRKKGNTNVMELLMKAPGVNGCINQRDKNGRTPLFYATLCRRDKNLSVLLNKGDPFHGSKLKRDFDLSGNQPDFWGTMPIIAAARNARSKTVKLLLEADPSSFHVKDAQGRGILWWAEASNEDGSRKTINVIRRFAQDQGLECEVSVPPAAEVAGQRSTSHRARNVAREDRWRCDVCTRFSVPHGGGYRCKVCDDGRFRICDECKEDGLSCRAGDGVHEIVKYVDLSIGSGDG